MYFVRAISEKGVLHYLSKGRFVICVILKYCCEEEERNRVSNVSIAERDHLFAKGYNAICDIIYPTLSKETQDARRKGEISYLRIYDLCRVFKVK